MARKRTIHDVASAAGVSPATVSRVMNGSAPVSADVQARVREAASRLSFTASPRYRANVIAFLLGNRPVLHHFHSRVLMGAEAYCAQRDFHPLFLPLRYSASTRWQDLNCPRILQRGLVDGFILAGTNTQNLLELVRHTGKPCSVLGNNVVGDWEPHRTNVVWFDDIDGAYQSTRYLIGLGHRSILFVGNRRLTWFERRYQGYSRAMTSAGLEPQPSGFDVDDDVEAGFLATKAALSCGKAFTAVVAGGDITAHGIYQCLRESGLKVPDDVSVAGFNDPEPSSFQPPLTHVDVFPEEIGRQLAAIVVARIENSALGPEQSLIPTRLVRRESCRPILDLATV